MCHMDAQTGGGLEVNIVKADRAQCCILNAVFRQRLEYRRGQVVGADAGNTVIPSGQCSIFERKPFVLHIQVDVQRFAPVSKERALVRTGAECHYIHGTVTPLSIRG